MGRNVASKTPEAPYPPSPRGVPDLAERTGAYRLRVVVVLISLFAFLGVYLGLLAASGWLVLETFTAMDGFFDICWFAMSAMLFVFLFKGLVKRGQVDLSGFVQVTEREQPGLFAFVRRLCKEEGTPFPGGIYLAHDVNAAVFYPRSLLTLFVPTRRNLLIGLGLVNTLNLSEFKAVLAHEFGHFAQSSMKLGQYVYVANQIIGGLVYGRDSWDEWLAKWRHTDIRIAWPAWGLTIVVWVLRHVLALLFRVINIANLSLSRQMEFNADLFAVRLCGSDPIVAGLWRTERAALAYQKAWADLHSLAQHRKFTDDAYHHQNEAIKDLDEFLAKNADTPHLRSLATPYRYGRKIHFQPSGEHSSTMWETHPPNRDREINAKRHYVPAEPVETPAWELFRNAERLRLRLTNVAYGQVLGQDVARLPRTRARKMNELVREEQAEMRQADHYRGFYEDRPVDPGDIDALAKEIDAGGADPDALREAAAAWTGERLAAFMGRLDSLTKEVDLLNDLATGRKSVDAKTFDFRGERCSIREAGRLAERVAGERAGMLDRLGEADQAIFRHFCCLTRAQPVQRIELMERYRFMIEVQTFILMLNQQESDVGRVLELLQRTERLNEQQYHWVIETLDDAHRRLEVALMQCGDLALPRLSHMDRERTVGDFVLQGGLVPAIDPHNPDPVWLQTFTQQFQQVLARLRKLHFKNLGNLLKLQESLDPELYGVAAQPA